MIGVFKPFADQELYQASLTEGLRRLCLGLAGLFLVFFIMDGVTISGRTAIIVCTHDIVLLVLFGLTYMWVRRQKGRVRRPHLWLATCALLGASNPLVTYVLIPEPFMITYLFVVLIGIGSFMLSWRWSIATFGIILVASALVIAPTLSQDDLVHVGLLMLTAVALSLAILVARRGVLERVAVLRLEVVERARGQADALLQAEAELFERRVAEEKAHRQREAADQIVETAPAIVVLLDLQGRLLRANSYLTKLTGVAWEEATGQGFVDRYVPAGHAQAMSGLRACMQGNASPDAAVAPLLCSDGKVRQVEWHYSALRDSSGTPTGLLAIGLDITDRERAERAAAEATERYLQSQKLEAVGRLAGGVAHDFNNLLCVILAAAAYALEELRDDSPVQGAAREIQMAAQRAADLTRQLLAFSRRQVLQPQVLDLNELLANLYKMLRRLLGEDIAIELRLAPGLASVLADAGQVEQVIVNLVVNARDAMPGGGVLTIEAMNSDPGVSTEERSTESLAGRSVRLRIRDTGCGMDGATLAKIFEPFFTTKPVGKGTGLGLATVYGIVEQSGGRIRVSSEPGQGTCFEIDLPACAAKVDMPAAPEASASLGGSETLLLVEDDAMVLRAARRMLIKAGYRVLTSRDGQEALFIFDQHVDEIGLLVTDVVMPGMSGRQLSDELLVLHPMLRVLFMSGYTDDSILHHGVLDPGVHFLAKPFTAGQLLAAVRRALARSGPVAA